MQRPDGIMGMGDFPLDFSFCLGEKGGFLLLQTVSLRNMIWVGLQEGPLLSIELSYIELGDSILTLDNVHFSVIDTGTTFVYISNRIYQEFMAAFDREMSGSCIYVAQQIGISGQSYCFKGKSEHDFQTFPVISFHFNGRTIDWGPEDYFFPLKASIYCLGIYENSEEYNLLGALFLKNKLISIDKSTESIGFFSSNCQRIHKYIRVPTPSKFPLIFLLAICILFLFFRLKNNPDFRSKKL